MDDVQNEFSIATDFLGGIYIPTIDNDDDRFLKDFLDKVSVYVADVRLRNPNIPDININIVDNDKFNALAFKSRSYHVGITKGLIIKLRDYFYSITLGDRLFNKTMFLKQKTEIYREKFIEYASKFLVYHELAHIRSGHCDYLNALNMNYLLEMASTCDKKEGILKQTLEYDADCTASTTVINQIIRASSDPDQVIENALINLLVYDAYDMDYFTEESCIFIFATYTLLRILGIDDDCYSKTNLDELEQSDHPHIGIRQENIMASISSIMHILQCDEPYIKSVCDKYIESFKLAELLYSNRERISKDIPMMVYYTHKGLRHYINVHNNWKYVRSELIAYSHDGLAPYEELSYEKFLENMQLID